MIKLHPRGLRLDQCPCKVTSCHFFRSCREENLQKRTKKEHPGSYRPVCCTLVPGKIVEQVILEDISGHVKKTTGNGQDGFTKVLMPNRPDHLLQ